MASKHPPRPAWSQPDVIVVGAGAVGASTAYHLAKLGVRVLLLEKEAGPAVHQSGRNSGVIHAGYNLKPGSSKARYCVEGSRRLRAYCVQRGVSMVQDGILVVASTGEKEPVLAELKRRADANGVEARIVDEHGLREIEPHARGVAALHAPEGASFDASSFVHRLIDDAAAAGAIIKYDVRIRSVHDGSMNGGPNRHITLQTSAGTFSAEALVNCAGLHADRLAGPLARDLKVIPFRGYYAELKPNRRDLVRGHIYAAPDLTFPFLGVHASSRADGRVLLGPGAMLAFGREAYAFHRVNVRDVADTLTWPGFYRLLLQPRFRSLIRSEVEKSLSLRAIWREANELIPDLRHSDLIRSFAGNRAQLVNRRGDLVDDILVRETDRALHVLNAVSPGLTCSLPFGESLAVRCRDKLEGDPAPSDDPVPEAGAPLSYSTA